MDTEILPKFITDNYEVYEWRHACAILKNDFPNEWEDIVEVLTAFRLRRTDILARGGGWSPISRLIDEGFSKRGWNVKRFDTKVVVDGREEENPTHKIDSYKNQIGLELEWNNKDPFFDRDLNNFRILFDLRAISVGVIITRSDGLQEIFDKLGKGASYGPSTTQMCKLMPRIHGGGGGGCPIVVFGITKKLYAAY